MRTGRGWRRAGWALVGMVGFLLSPLSWWNDLYVNLPIAYLVANGFSRANPGFFLPVLTATYWLTNILGLALVQLGAVRATGAGHGVRLTRRAAVKWLFFSLLYTALVIALGKAGVIRPFLG